MSHESTKAVSHEWYTPPRVFAALGLEFDLDPCAPPLPLAPWIPARRRLSLPVDGLGESWCGRVWLNPPYGRESARWVGRLADHGDGIALVFTRVDTPWAQSALEISDAVCFVRGRIDFLAGPGAPLGRSDKRSRAGAPSMLLAFGATCATAVNKSGLGVTMHASDEPWELATP